MEICQGPAQDATRAPRALLRLEVGMFRARESRRVFDASVQVGVPAGARDSFVVRARDLPAIDAALRVDVLCALLEDTAERAGYAWLIRSGGVETRDTDLAWLRAAETAFAIVDRPLDGFFVVTRAGWCDVRTREQRTWRRLRL